MPSRSSARKLAPERSGRPRRARHDHDPLTDVRSSSASVSRDSAALVWRLRDGRDPNPVPPQFRRRSPPAAPTAAGERDSMIAARSARSTETDGVKEGVDKEVERLALTGGGHDLTVPCEPGPVSTDHASARRGQPESRGAGPRPASHDSEARRPRTPHRPARTRHVCDFATARYRCRSHVFGSGHNIALA
jgi:hypothetical protein